MKSKELELMTVREASERLQISRNTAYSLLKRGDIEGYKVGRMWRIPDKSILNYIMPKKEEVYHEQEDRKKSK